MSKRLRLELARHSAVRAAAEMRLNLKGHVDSLSAIAIVAPLVGIIVTVQCMITSSSNVMGERHAVEAAMVRMLIVSLVPAACGLLIGVLSQWWHGYLSGRVEMFNTEMRCGWLELESYLDKKAERSA